MSLRIHTPAGYDATPAAAEPPAGDPVIASIPEIITELHAGRMVVLVDDENRENEGDLVMAAEHVTPEAINFMARHGRGLICLTLARARCEQLGLKLMVAENTSRHSTNFTVTIEAATGVTTGISTADRARTVQAAVARNATSADIVQPGHIFPLMAQDGGVLVRAGHTEAGSDLAAMAGGEPAAVICEILNEDGTMARLPDLVEFARTHRLRIGTIADLISYRAHHETLVERVGECSSRTQWGPLRVVVYKDRAYHQAHVALVHGEISPEQETWVRVHEPMSVFDWLSLDAPSRSWSLPRAIEAIGQQAAGVVILLNAGEDADHVIANFDERLAFARQGNSGTRPPRALDFRTYGIGAQLLKDLGVRRMRLMGRPHRMPSISPGFDLEITGYELQPEEPC